MLTQQPGQIRRISDNPDAEMRSARNKVRWNLRPQRRCHRGQALVPIVFIMVILTVLAVGFATSASREVRASSNFTSQTQRFYAAKGALNYAAVALAQTSNNG